ncbi:MAG: hypothetical protein NTW21_03500 [Verrucomicrobia bacterium]|nr:hypothetical protein [Verrucomicrobiota bacterium]
MASLPVPERSGKTGDAAWLQQAREHVLTPTTDRVKPVCVTRTEGKVEEAGALLSEDGRSCRLTYENGRVNKEVYDRSPHDGYFLCSDERLNRLWYISTWTLQIASLPNQNAWKTIDGWLLPRKLEISALGPVLTTRLDGAVIDETRDETFAAGSVGFYTPKEKWPLFDSITVKDGKEQKLLSDDFSGDLSKWQFAHTLSCVVDGGKRDRLLWMGDKVEFGTKTGGTETVSDTANNLVCGDAYHQLFSDMAVAWKQDFPNLQHYYIFQIWPNACAGGGHDGAGDRLREAQRTLPRLYSNMDIMSTLGIKPAGGCHYPLTGWAEFARLMQPLIERDIYGNVPADSITAPNLRRKCHTGPAKDAIALKFDQPVVWADWLTGQFYLDGAKEKVASGAVTGNAVTLKLKEPSAARRITYLKEAAWTQDKLTIGVNGITALTFCDVPLER